MEEKRAKFILCQSTFYDDAVSPVTASFALNVIQKCEIDLLEDIDCIIYKGGISLYFGDIEIRRWEKGQQFVRCFYEEHQILHIGFINFDFLSRLIHSKEFHVSYAPWE